MFYKFNSNNDFSGLAKNKNAIWIIEQNLDKLYYNDWYFLSRNPKAVHILEQNLDKVYWSELSSNPNAIHIIEQNLDKINYSGLSSNPNAIHIIEQNLNKLTVIGVSKKNDENITYFHQGLAMRDFKHTYTLSDFSVVRGADIVDGILSIFIENVIPEEKKTKSIPIGFVDKRLLTE